MSFSKPLLHCPSVRRLQIGAMAVQSVRYNREMAVEPCTKCGKPKNDEAAVCPHCGARKGGAAATGELGKQQLSQAELRALLLTSKLSQAEPSQGLISTLVLPHPGTEGGARLAELTLTVLCAPLILVGTLAVALRNRIRGKAISTVGEATPVLVMVLFGSFSLDLVLSLLGVSGTGRLVIGVGSVVGLCVRAVIRARAGRRGREGLDM